jgi:hypothetical protein
MFPVRAEAMGSNGTEHRRHHRSGRSIQIGFADQL